MKANIIDRVELPVHVRQRHGLPLHLKFPNRPRRHIRSPGSPRKIPCDLLVSDFAEYSLAFSSLAKEPG